MLTLLAYLFGAIILVMLLKSKEERQQEKEWEHIFSQIEAEKRLKQQEYYANSPIIRFAKWLMIAMLVIAACCYIIMIVEYYTGIV